MLLGKSWLGAVPSRAGPSYLILRQLQRGHENALALKNITITITINALTKIVKQGVHGLHSV